MVEIIDLDLFRVVEFKCSSDFPELLMVTSNNRSTIFQLQKSVPDNIPVKFSKIWEHNVQMTPLTVAQSSSVLTFVAQFSNSDCYFSLELLAAVDNMTCFFPKLELSFFSNFLKIFFIFRYFMM